MSTHAVDRIDQNKQNDKSCSLT